MSGTSDDRSLDQRELREGEGGGVAVASPIPEPPSVVERAEYRIGIFESLKYVKSLIRRRG